VHLYALPLCFALAGFGLYVILGGADFGAGIWQLTAGTGPAADRIRDHAHHSIGPVWEANHVWLIFVLTVFWTAYPKAFGSIASTLAIPLFIAGLGIIFRGAAYAVHAGAASPRESRIIQTTFSISSILTPFALGAAIGGIATDRVPVGNAAGAPFWSWLNPTSVFIGLLAVTSCAYLAAAFLAADAARDGDSVLARSFRRRALAAGLIAGAIALAGLVIVYFDHRRLALALLTGPALGAVIASFVAGLGTLISVSWRRFELARYSAAVAVASIVAGWALARWPLILPGLTVHGAAAGHRTLVWVVLSVIVGGAIVLPSIGLLFRLTLTGRLQDGDPAPETVASDATRGLRQGPFGRSAIAFLVAGIALLTVAEASWAHAVGVVCLFGFVLSGFVAWSGATRVPG
jgi:cytochrome bd ubiquinol oxidase subunit II